MRKDKTYGTENWARTHAHTASRPRSVLVEKRQPCSILCCMCGCVVIHQSATAWRAARMIPLPD